MARVAVGVLEPEPALAEVDLARDAGLDHPLQRPVDRGAADVLVLAVDQIVEVVRAEVALVPEEHVEDRLALARSLAARRAQAVEIGEGRGPWQLRSRVRVARVGPEPQPAPAGISGCSSLVRRERLAAAARGHGVGIANGEAAAGDVVHEVHFGALEIPDADGIDVELDAVRLAAPGRCPPGLSSIIRPYWKPEQPPPWTNTRRPDSCLFSSASSSAIFDAAVGDTLMSDSVTLVMVMWL